MHALKKSNKRPLTNAIYCLTTAPTYSSTSGNLNFGVVQSLGGRLRRLLLCRAHVLVRLLVAVQSRAVDHTSQVERRRASRRRTRCFHREVAGDHGHLLHRHWRPSSSGPFPTDPSYPALLSCSSCSSCTFRLEGNVQSHIDGLNFLIFPPHTTCVTALPSVGCIFKSTAFPTEKKLLVLDGREEPT